MNNNTIKIFDFTISSSIETLNFNDKSVIINTINPFSYCVAKKDQIFRESLRKSDFLIPDGIGIVIAARLISKQKIHRIAGADLHEYILKLVDKKKGKVFYLGSMNSTLKKIKERVEKEYPNIQLQYYSPPYKQEFSEGENNDIIAAINSFKPNALFIGMTAPKQEKWAFQNKDHINTNIIASIGAVFDFYAGTVKRAPKWMILFHLEWLYRLIKQPKHMIKRYRKLPFTTLITDIIKFNIYERFKKNYQYSTQEQRENGNC